MKTVCFEQGSIGTNCYIVFDENSHKGFCVDISDHASASFYRFIKEEKIELIYLLLTHGHYDHTQDIGAFHREFPYTKIVISQIDYENIQAGLDVFCEASIFPKPDILCTKDSELTFSQKPIQVIETPGHTSGSVCYLFENMLFCGDTVFKGSIGRTDLPTGSFCDIMQSVKKIASLGNLKLLPGHMETTDIATQLIENPYFRV
ncbi:MAG: MBL fold metallo-hydrolase [Clostridia bacterium]|nr:MBL fold metallo-hydrolase [Clostridia bacterium]